MAEQTNPNCPDMPKISDSQYAKKVCCPERIIDFNAKKENVIEDIKKEIVTCRNLMCAWSDSNQVIEDCEKLIKSANDEIHKDKDSVDVHSAYEALLQIRQRLAQASHSYRNIRWVIFHLLYQLTLLGVCAFLIIYYRLLPGQTPRVASLNINVAVLFSSALFGAIGGLFDGLSALST